MKMRSFALALALAGAPLALAAQQGDAPKPEPGARREWRGERGMHGPRGMRGMRGEPGRNPVQRLIERREQLGLTADQVSRLQAIGERVESQNRPLVERLQALRQQAGLPQRPERGAQGERGGERPRRPELTAEQRAAMERMREQARPVMEQLRQNAQAARRDVEAVLTDAQKQQLRQMHERRGHRGLRGEGRRWREGQQRRPGVEARPQGSGTQS